MILYLCDKLVPNQACAICEHEPAGFGGVCLACGVGTNAGEWKRRIQLQDVAVDKYLQFQLSDRIQARQARIERSRNIIAAAERN